MDRAKEAELFDSLMRNRGFREWVAEAMQEQVKVLLVNQDAHQIARAQGAAAMLTRITDRIDAAEKSARR